MGPKSKGCCPSKERHRHTQGGVHVKIEAETGVKQLQARNTKDCWQAAETRKRQEGILSRVFSSVALPTPCLQMFWLKL